MSDLNLCICLTIWKHLEGWTWRRFHLYSVLGRKEWKSSTNCQGKQQSSILVVQFISWMVCWSNLIIILWFHHSDFRIYDSSRTVLSCSGSSQHPFAWKWLLELLGGQWKGGNRWELIKYFFFFNRFVCNDCRSNDVTFIIGLEKNVSSHMKNNILHPDSSWWRRNSLLTKRTQLKNSFFEATLKTCK